MNLPKTDPKKQPAESALLLEVFKTLKAIGGSDPGAIAVSDALDDASAAIREVRNELANPIRQSFNEIALKPLAKRVEKILGTTPGLAAEFAVVVFSESIGRVGLEALRQHLRDRQASRPAPSQPAAKATTPAPVIDLASMTNTAVTSIGGVA